MKHSNIEIFIIYFNYEIFHGNKKSTWSRLIQGKDNIENKWQKLDSNYNRSYKTDEC